MSKYTEHVSGLNMILKDYNALSEVDIQNIMNEADKLSNLLAT